MKTKLNRYLWPRFV